MCIASVVTGHYEREFGRPWVNPAPYGEPPLIPSPSYKIISQQEWEEYQRLKKAAQEIDQKTNQPHCIHPGLADWEGKMEEFLINKGVLPKPE